MRDSKSMRSSWRLLASLVIAASLAAGSAAAQGAQSAQAEASDHHRAGVAYAKSGKWEQAVHEFEEAYRLDPTPLRLYDVGQVSLQAKLYVRARDAYTKVERSSALSSDQQQRARAGLATAKANIARVRISVANAKPADVVTLDGAKVDSESVDVDPGKHTVRLTRDGESTETIVDVAPGAEATASIGEKKTQEQPVVDGGATEPASSGTPVVAWIFTGASVAAVGTGVTLMIVGNNEYQDVKDSGCEPRCEGRDEAGRQKVLIGNIVLGAGILSGLAAAYFFIWGGPDKPSAQKRATSSTFRTVDVAAAPGGGLIGVRGSF